MNINIEKYDRTTSFESILFEEPLKLISLSDVIIEEKTNNLKKQTNIHNIKNDSFCYSLPFCCSSSFWRYFLYNMRRFKRYTD